MQCNTKLIQKQPQFNQNQDINQQRLDQKLIHLFTHDESCQNSEPPNQAVTSFLSIS